MRLLHHMKMLLETNHVSRLPCEVASPHAGILASNMVYGSVNIAVLRWDYHNFGTGLPRWWMSLLRQ